MRQSKRQRRPSKRNPNRQRIIPDHLRRTPLQTRDGTGGKGNGNRHSASVSRRIDREAHDLITAKEELCGGIAVIERHAVNEDLDHIVDLDLDERPVRHGDEAGSDGLGPHLVEGPLFRDAVDGCGLQVDDPQVRLVEHEGGYVSGTRFRRYLGRGQGGCRFAFGTRIRGGHRCRRRPLRLRWERGLAIRRLLHCRFLYSRE